MDRYVVALDECAGNNPTPDKVWLEAIDYRLYPGRGGSRVTTADESEAFVFTTLAAAEFAAVFVGGVVEALEH